jgi:dihydropteroate synthase
LTASAIFPRERVTVVGVLNATPDSFSDGGRLVDDRGAVDADAAVAVAARMIEAGAQMIDVGGESTRPGAMETPPVVEIDRTAPVVEALAKRFAERGS